MTLKGKIAIVTGGGRDIGRSVSLRLAAEGAQVAVIYRNDEASARTTVADIAAAGGTGQLFRADMRSASEVQAMVAQVRQCFGDRIDILVNVAGGMVARKPIEEIEESFFDEVMTLNLKSTFLATQAVLPFMQPGAAIVNFSSQAGRDGGGPGASIYATSKGALMTLTRAMAKEFGPRGIRVNALCPGMIDTSFHDTFTKPEARKNVAGAAALRREGRPEEVANLVAFLASDEASYITGANLDVNGGLCFS